MVPVVTAQEMLEVEKRAYARGASEAEFMHNAGKEVAEAAWSFVQGADLEKRAVLLVGKGNNGGDAFAAGVELLKEGFEVKACHLYPLEECSPLCRSERKRFEAAGGRVSSHIPLEEEGILIDGLVGTGFKGKAEGVLAEAIEKANGLKVPILSIDIPSGLNGTTGEVASIAIQATQTVALGLPKIGFFVGQGWDHVGELILGDFGLSSEEMKSARPSAFIFDTFEAECMLPQMKRSRHKYEAGYVLGVAGSPGMSGAALLSAFSSLRSGAGIVRLFHPKGMEAEFSSFALEVVKEGFEPPKSERILEEAERARALFIGPGLGRNQLPVDELLKVLLSSIKIPCVLDADALFFLSKHPHVALPRISVLTPHRREMEQLLGQAFPEDESLHDACQQFVDRRRVTLILKGAPTFIFHPGKVPCIVPRGDPGMATAGAGDVLTGIVAALLAQKLPPLEAALLGVWLHAVSGEIAAEEKTSYAMVASDIIECLPKAFGLNTT